MSADATPVFAPGDLVQLAAIVETAKELAIQAERNAEVLRRLATDLSNSLKRADALRSPRPQPAERAKKDAFLGKGPRRILEILSERGRSASRSQVKMETRFSDSTLRTYIPALKKAGYITENFGLLILTQKRPPMEFTAR